MPIHVAMQISSQLILFGASLFAILILYGIAAALGLGRERGLRDDEHVRFAASEAVDGFQVDQIARDSDGAGALVQGTDGQIMLLKSHGNQIAGRILGPLARARIVAGDNARLLEIDCGEPRFGTVQLHIEDSESWAEAINRVDGSCDA